VLRTLSTSSCATLANRNAGPREDTQMAQVMDGVGVVPRLDHGVGVMIGMGIHEGMWSLRHRRWGGMEIRGMFIRHRRSSGRCMRIADEFGYGVVLGASTSVT
jgi:hypothetical protein